ncbi:S-Ena type endospore appendage [Chengkuizengella sp. SCS-71B]|uniref:S-Ena type endospore appendage n=1 Tax=Chengkuizengella sp. SCS-71B TaxID=3115290 RepID=UPI0032C2357D
MSCNSYKSDVCCPISCAGIDLFPSQLILIKRCTPIRTQCDNSTEATLFTTTITTTSQLPSGMITVVNTSSECTMTVTVTDEGVATPYEVMPLSSITVEVSSLSLVTVTCDGTDPDAFCNGTFDADLQYTINK